MFFGKSKKNTDKPDLPEVFHPSEDGTARFYDDQRLRKFGFVILARPKNKPAVWQYGGVSYSEQEALDFIEDLEDMQGGT